MDIDIKFFGESLDGGKEVDVIDVLDKVNDISRGAANETMKRPVVIDDELGLIAVVADGANASELGAAL